MTQTHPPLIDAARLPHRTLRDGELYLKRRVFAVERGAVLRLQALYAAAFNDVRAMLLDTADQTTQWRAPVEAYAQARVARLKTDVMGVVEASAGAALLGGYFGRLWLLDMATHADVRVNVPPLLLNGLREGVYDSLIRDLLGKDWRTQYELELDALTLDIRRAIGTGLQNGEGMDAIVRRVRDAMGVVTDRRRGAVGSAERRGYRANFNRVQTLTRTTVQTQANTGAVAAYKANADILSGYEWITAHDERTCPICRGFDGKVFGLKSNFRPPAHPNCRCSVIPVLKPDALADAKPAPRATLRQWARGYGMESELAAFMQG